MQAAVRVEEEDMPSFLTYWNMKMRTNYRQMVNRAKKSRKKPQFMSDDVWADFQAYWDTEDAKVSFNDNIHIYNIDCIILHHRVSNVIESSS